MWICEKVAGKNVSVKGAEELQWKAVMRKDVTDRDQVCLDFPALVGKVQKATAAFNLAELSGFVSVLPPVESSLVRETSRRLTRISNTLYKSLSAHTAFTQGLRYQGTISISVIKKCKRLERVTNVLWEMFDSAQLLIIKVIH